MVTPLELLVVGRWEAGQARGHSATVELVISFVRFGLQQRVFRGRFPQVTDEFLVLGRRLAACLATHATTHALV